MKLSCTYSLLLLITTFVSSFSYAQVSVAYVTSLSDAGVGTLRDALLNSGQDTIIIDVAGQLTLENSLQLQNDVVILGPSPTHFSIAFSSSFSSSDGVFGFNGKSLRLSGVEIKESSFGVFNINFSNVVDALTVSNCLFTENKRANGNGGVLNLNSVTSKVKFNSCSFWGNEVGLSLEQGGAIYAESGKLKVFNCTFYANKAFIGGGIKLQSIKIEGEIVNNTFYGNEDFVTPTFYRGAAVSFNNLPSNPHVLKNNIFFNSQTPFYTSSNNYVGGNNFTNYTYTTTPDLITDAANINLNSSFITDGFGLKYFVFNNENSDCIDVDAGTPVELLDARGSWRKMYGRADLYSGQFLGSNSIDAGAIEYSPLKVLNADNINSGTGSIVDVFSALNDPSTITMMDGRKTIVFEIPSSANQVHNIAINNATLVIPGFSGLDNLIINGYSQDHSKVAGPGLTQSVVTPAFIPVQINGGTLGGTRLSIEEEYITVSGMSFVNSASFSSPYGKAIEVSGNSCSIEGCHIGVESDGMTVNTNNYGIVSTGSFLNVGIRNHFYNYKHVSRNIITGNNITEIELTTGGDVSNNFIGLLGDGTSSTTEVGVGIRIMDGSANIGGSKEQANYFGKLDTALNVVTGEINHNYIGFEYDLNTSASINHGIVTRFSAFGSSMSLNVKNNFFGNINTNAIESNLEYVKIQGNTFGLTPFNRSSANITGNGIILHGSNASIGFASNGIGGVIGQDQFFPSADQSNIIVNCQNSAIAFKLVDYVDPYNQGNGSVLSDLPASIDCRIIGNYIGIDTAASNLSANFGNGYGVFIDDSIYNIRIDSNVIAKNINTGIVVSDSTKGVFITENSIYENGGSTVLGIDLDNNATPNIIVANRPKSNSGMLPPEILGSIYCSEDDSVKLKLKFDIPDKDDAYKLEFFIADVSSFEGQTYLMDTVMNFSTFGVNIIDTLSFPSTVLSSGQTITATLTRMSYSLTVGFEESVLSSTSEFSAPFTINIFNPTTPLSSNVCSGVSDTVFITGLGNANISWMTLSTLTTQSNLDSIFVFTSDNAGVDVIITANIDTIGCLASLTKTIEIKESPIFGSVVFTDDPCILGDNTLEVTAENGTSPYTYSINGSPGNIATLPNNSYMAKVTDVIGCVYEEEVVFNEPSIISFDLITTNPNCNGDLGGITVNNLFGGVGPYSYSLDGGTTLQASTVFSGLVPNSYTISVLDINGCQMNVLGGITEPIKNENTINETICFGMTYSQGSNTYSSDGIYTDVFVASNGCDSTVTLNLTVVPQILTDSTAVVCGAYTWYGNTYNVSGTYQHALTSVSGCDSIINLDLTINQFSSGTDTQITCGSFLWIDGNTYTSSNNTAIHTLVNAVGCDSVVTLNLTINNGDVTTDTQEACGSFLWIDGNTYTSSNNTATHTLTNVLGCDSVITLNLIINPVPTFEVSETSIKCEGDNNGELLITNYDNGNGPYFSSINASSPSPIFNYTGLLSGSYDLTVENVHGCITLKSLTLIDPTSIIFDNSQVDITNDECNNGSGQISFANAIGGVGGFEYSLDNLNWINDTIFNNLTPNNYIIYIRDLNDCQLSDGPYTIANGTTVTPLIPKFEQPIVFCEGQSMVIVDTNIANQGLEHRYYYQPSTFYETSNDENIVLNNDLPETNSIFVYAVTSIGGCSGDTAELAIEYVTSYSNLVYPELICEEDEIAFEFQTTTTDFDSIYWKLNDDSGFVYANTVNLNTGQIGQYEFKMFKESCQFSTSVLVSLAPNCNSKNVVTTNAFSPDGDYSENQTFIIDLEIIEKADDVSVTVYNRWGDIIFKVDDYDNKENVWDGNNLAGDPMPEGTYFYIVSSQSEEFTTSGWVYLDLKN